MVNEWLMNPNRSQYSRVPGVYGGGHQKRNSVGIIIRVQWIVTTPQSHCYTERSRE
jgi:hypothetical protein